MNPYQDIIGLPHPEPPKGHPRMSRLDSAAQFAPFAALTGFGARIAGKAQEKMDRSEYNFEDYD